MVDLPPEEDDEAHAFPAQAAGLNFIRLATPHNRRHRACPRWLENTSGFVTSLRSRHQRQPAEAQAAMWAPRSPGIKAADCDLPVVRGLRTARPEGAEAIRVGGRRRGGGQRHLGPDRRGATRGAVLDFVRGLAEGAPPRLSPAQPGGAFEQVFGLVSSTGAPSW